MDRPVRVLLDVNIYIGSIIATQRGHTGTATQTLLSMIGGHQWGSAGSAQLLISLEMIETLETVLRRLGFPTDLIRAYSTAIVDIMKYGPEELDPYLVLGGEERFALPDVEDAGVLATAFAARADLLVTDNLRDFATKDALSLETQVVMTTSAGPRTLQAFRYQAGQIDLIVAHPFDVMNWIRSGHDFTPSNLWEKIARS